MMNIDEYLNLYNDFDIRQTHDARYVDQKCRPDIVCFIADCILNTSCATKTFTINDLWDERFFIDNCRVILANRLQQIQVQEMSTIKSYVNH